MLQAVSRKKYNDRCERESGKIAKISDAMRSQNLGTKTRYRWFLKSGALKRVIFDSPRKLDMAAVFVVSYPIKTTGRLKTESRLQTRLSLTQDGIEGSSLSLFQPNKIVHVDHSRVPLAVSADNLSNFSLRSFFFFPDHYPTEASALKLESESIRCNYKESAAAQSIPGLKQLVLG